MNSHIQAAAPVKPPGRPCPPLNVHTRVGNPGLHPAKSLQSMAPAFHVGIGLGTVHPLSVPCSIAMHFAPRFWASSAALVHVPSLIPVDCIQAIGSCALVGISMV